MVQNEPRLVYSSKQSFFGPLNPFCRVPPVTTVDAFALIPVERPFTATILIIDDDSALRRMARILLEKDRHTVIEAEDGRRGVELYESADPDVVLLDVGMPVMDGFEACRRMRRIEKRVPPAILMMTAYTDGPSVEQAFETGATDFIAKPAQWAVLRQRITHMARMRQAEKQVEELRKVEQVRNYAEELESGAATLVGDDPAFAPIRQLVRVAATSNATVLITGETGTGKNVVAKAIHYAADSRRRSFLSVNCAAIPETLIEAELFGVARGAYTGAVNPRKGIFELADGGTLFLDEIGEMPLALQSKLLGVLEDRTVKRIGSETSRTVDVRIIAATNVPPEEAVRAGKLRQDLYYRLNVIHIHLLPLRERPRDIPALCQHFARTLAPNRRVIFPDAELAALQAYDFPGNVRELRNIVERCLLLQRDETLHPSALLGKPSFTTVSEVHAETPPAPAPPSGPILTMEELERRHISDTFTRLGGNQTRTAEALGLSLSTLKRRLKSISS
jgi:DNA-binding NtrC family response regulator